MLAVLIWFGLLLCESIFFFFPRNMAISSLGRLVSTSSYFFLCDVQEKFRPNIKFYPEIINVSNKMVSSVSIWGSGGMHWNIKSLMVLKFNELAYCMPVMWAKKKRKIFDDGFFLYQNCFCGHFPTLVKDSWSLFGASIS